ncbi:hypothetical protein BDK51DRAFT_44364 [Blyttiomyces helicus]|uniref:SCP domain-containing protein n=1 Tax=Blyttiomyces helicus TaxID=388810 RepID=A0A4P9W468_9FUNG|nr:hypothetical protein BDK51DRAFT_44364 [Blyttiomyces helicus]|eukprot:RKO86974.1 hypothetical protein BDK51DRAFT_44364 [Blyttiomyces helicus]
MHTHTLLLPLLLLLILLLPQCLAAPHPIPCTIPIPSTAFTQHLSPRQEGGGFDDVSEGEDPMATGSSGSGSSPQAAVSTQASGGANESFEQSLNLIGIRLDLPDARVQIIEALDAADCGSPSSSATMRLLPSWISSWMEVVALVGAELGRRHEATLSRQHMGWGFGTRRGLAVDLGDGACGHPSILTNEDAVHCGLREGIIWLCVKAGERDLISSSIYFYFTARPLFQKAQPEGD